MYVKGEGVAKDDKKARELYEKAGEAGHAGSIRVLIRAAYWRDKQASLDGNGN
jgi:TPR repeat protein